MVKFRQKGNFEKASKYFKDVIEAVRIGDLDKYGEAGVAALASATPVDSGLTASSWYYKVIRQNGRVSLEFYNSHVSEWNPHVQIAIILQYGHATRNGGWAEGRDYINPAIQPIFDDIARKMWREVVKA